MSDLWRLLPSLKTQSMPIWIQREHGTTGPDPPETGSDPPLNAGSDCPSGGYCVKHFRHFQTKICDLWSAKTGDSLSFERHILGFDHPQSQDAVLPALVVLLRVHGAADAAPRKDGKRGTQELGVNHGGEESRRARDHRGRENRTAQRDSLPGSVAQSAKAAVFYF